MWMMRVKRVDKKSRVSMGNMMNLNNLKRILMLGRIEKMWSQQNYVPQSEGCFHY